MLAIDLASHGYVVATISHTYEAAEVEFPDQRVELARAEDPNNIHTNIALSIRRADVQFVIDELTALEGGANPDAEHRLLPAGLRGALDLAKIGIYGHSLGGATAADAMANDARIVAGINLDGSFHTETIDPGAMPPPGSPPEQIAAFIAALNRVVAPRPSDSPTADDYGRQRLPSGAASWRARLQSRSRLRSG
jgi:predicted dienelactone hydrolase